MLLKKSRFWLLFLFFSSYCLPSVMGGQPLSVNEIGKPLPAYLEGETPDAVTSALPIPPDKKSFDPGKLIIDHVLDKYGWHLFDIGEREVTLPLPVILIYQARPYLFLSHRFEHGYAAYKGFRISKEGMGKGRIIRVLDDGITPDPQAGFILDLSITKNALAVFISCFLICWFFITAGRSYRRFSGESMPRGVASLVEPVIVFIRDQIALTSIGPRHYERFMPFLLTLFFFIFFNNLIGLVPFFPGGANVTGNIAVTMVLALFTFFTMQIFGTREYWRHVFNTPGVPFWLKIPIPLMPLIEIVGILIKPFVLMIRLFANITAGHMVILGFVSIIFVLSEISPVFGGGIAPITVVFLIFLNFLKILVAFLQAYVFTLFSALFFGMATPEPHH